MDDYSHTRELSLALEAYVGALSGWSAYVEALNREREIRGLGHGAIGVRDERQLYRFAREAVDTSSDGDGPEGEGTGKLVQAARRYLMGCDRLLNALEDLTHHLEDLSAGDDV
jgi:hypothetical protein